MRRASMAMVLIAGVLHASPAVATSDIYNQYIENTLRPQAEAGDAKAQTSLGIAYQTGQGVPQDPVAAVSWLQKAADQGYAAGEFFLGSAYASGQGVAVDSEEAAKWWRKSVEQGYVHAKTSLGRAYYAGSGVPKDHALAMKLLREAAEQGDGAAIDFLHLINVPVTVQVGPPQGATKQ